MKDRGDERMTLKEILQTVGRKLED